MNIADQTPRVLFGEEACGHMGEQENIEKDGKEKDKDCNQRVAQDPGQRVFVSPENLVEEIFGELVKLPVLLLLRSQKQGAHHRRGGQGNHHGNKNGHGQRDGEFP